MARPGELRYGDFVSWVIPGREKGLRHHGYVLGVLRCAQEIADVVMVGDKKVFGLPIHVGHLTLVSIGHQLECWEIRSRFLERYPDTIL